MDDIFHILFAAAIQFSHLPPMDPPPIVGLHRQEMLLQVCNNIKGTPDYTDCIQQHGLVSAYIIEEHRLVYSIDDLDINDDTDNSYILHEYVHALQAHQYGDKIFETCEGTFDMEQQAYTAQQAYLKSRNQMRMVGERLRYISCRNLK